MNRYQTLLESLNQGGRILIDGATGTEIEKRGADMVKGGWNGAAALTHPEVIRQVHEDYIIAGAEIIITNSFSTSRHVLRDASLEQHFEFLNRHGVELAIEARNNMNKPEVLVAGGITHWSFTGNFPSLDQLRSNTEEQAAIMADAGVDLFILEMMTDIERLLTLIEATQKTGMPVWVGFSCRLDDHGNPVLLDGPPLLEGIKNIQDKGVPVVFIMHTEVEYIPVCLEVLKSNWKGPMGVYAHSGKFVEPNWIFDGVISPEDYAQAAKSWLDQGVQLVGGCCGIGIEHIHSLNKVVRKPKSSV